MLSPKKAFTLVELLVAITIIGILASLVAQNYTSSKIKAQDASIKSSVRNYRGAMELYYAKNKTYLIGCSGSYDTAATVTGFRRSGTGADCVGYKGSGEGQMTRRGNATGSLTHYNTTTSIADALVKEGVLSAVATFPEAKDFHRLYVRKTNSGADVAADFILTICDSEGYEARTKETASTFAIYAQPLKADSVSIARANKLCGAQPYGWNVLESLDR